MSASNFKAIIDPFAVMFFHFYVQFLRFTSSVTSTKIWVARISANHVPTYFIKQVSRR